MNRQMLAKLFPETCRHWPHMTRYGRFEHGVVQTVFGAIMTLRIAMECKHSIVGVLERRESIIHVKTVMLIAIMALARKFIIIDPTAQPPAMLLALAGVILALGVV